MTGSQNNITPEFLIELKTLVHLRDIFNECGLESVYDRYICPFHDDTNPSLTFVQLPNGEHWKCWACDAQGDAIDFIQKYKNLEFHEAVSYLAKSVNIELPSNQINPIHEKTLLELSATLPEYISALKGGPLDYLLSRGFTKEFIEKSQLGYCTIGYFSGRITIPHFKNGRLVNMTGRSVNGNLEPKYLKLGKDKIAHSGVFNEDALSRAEVVLCEGEMDCLSLLQEGFNAIGILGVQNFKPELFSKTKKVVVLLDNDSAGREAAEKIANILGSKSVIACIPPEYNDINDCLVKCQANLKEIISKAIAEARSLWAFKLDARVDLPSIEKLKEILPESAFEQERFWSKVKTKGKFKNNEVKALRKDVEALKEKTSEKREAQVTEQDGYNDIWLAAYLIEKIKGNTLYNRDAGWLKYADGRWARNEAGITDEIQKHIKELSLNPDSELQDIGEKASNSGRIFGLKALLEGSKELYKEYCEFDANPDLINFPNGVLEKTPEGVLIFREHRAQDLLMQQAPTIYNPDLVAKRWATFIEEITANEDGSLNLENAKYLQVYLGYAALSGRASERSFLVLRGTGDNGKGVLFRSITGVIGHAQKNGYAGSIAANALTIRQGSGNTPELAACDGARLVSCSETDMGAKTFSSEMLKKISSGGDLIEITPKYEHTRPMKAGIKLVISTNGRFPIDDNCPGFWDRINELIFKRKFKRKPGEDMHEMLIRTEASGILNWLIEGYKNWLIEGLPKCEEVEKNRIDYRSEASNLADKFNETFEIVEPDDKYLMWDNVQSTLNMKTRKEGREIKAFLAGYNLKVTRCKNKLDRDKYVIYGLKYRFGEMGTSEVLI